MQEKNVQKFGRLRKSSYLCSRYSENPEHSTMRNGCD